MELKKSIFLVQFSQPQEEANGRVWNRNLDLMVVADSMESAMQGVRDQYPNATFHAINRKGTNQTVLVIE